VRNFKLSICYEGTRYNGWQKQGNTEKTIQGRLEAALGEVLGHPVEISGSGRTDAGVHAREQVASFHSGTNIPRGLILDELRKRLPEDIGAISLEEAPSRFHARLSCVEKTYVYRVWNSSRPNVFDRRVLWVLPGSLNLDSMRSAAECLIGTHDFSAFCANRHMKKSAVRALKTLTIERQGSEVRFILTGNGFLYNMARIIAGTLLQVGLGERHPDEMAAILASKDRQQAGPAAPAQGLTLWEIRYPQDQ